MDDLRSALTIIDGHPLADFIGVRSETLLAAAETALGLKYPAIYREFLRRFGAGSFGAFGVYGVIREPFGRSVPDGVWMTLDSRRAPCSLPTSMVIIGSDGMGGDYVLDTQADAEPPVQVWLGGRSREGDDLETLAPDFGAFLLAEVQAEASGSLLE